MNRYLPIIVIMISFIPLMHSCEDAKMPQVYYSGALRSIMGGNIEATIALDTVGKNNLYALGAAENLRGEIQVFDGKSFSTRVVDREITFEESFNQHAALLVYAVVPEWQEIAVPSDIKTKEMLEEFVEKTAMERNYDMNQPFPFLLKGSINSLSWHVINWPEDDTVHTHEKHQNSGLKGVVKNQDVTIIGFFSFLVLS